MTRIRQRASFYVSCLKLTVVSHCLAWWDEAVKSSAGEHPPHWPQACIRNQISRAERRTTVQMYSRETDRDVTVPYGHETLLLPVYAAVSAKPQGSVIHYEVHVSYARHVTAAQVAAVIMFTAAFFEDTHLNLSISSSMPALHNGAYASKEEPINRAHIWVEYTSSSMLAEAQ